MILIDTVTLSQCTHCTKFIGSKTLHIFNGRLQDMAVDTTVGRLRLILRFFHSLISVLNIILALLEPILIGTDSMNDYI